MSLGFGNVGAYEHFSAENGICLDILAIRPPELHQTCAGIPRDGARRMPVIRGFPAFASFLLIAACRAVFLLACLYRQIPEAACCTEGMANFNARRNLVNGKRIKWAIRTIGII
ncbi:hypothetical protein KPA97_29235, partial [Burkholderia cenocepacia]|nr:hypothetical protein [Burkholderia cenocepacia]